MILPREADLLQVVLTNDVPGFQFVEGKEKKIKYGRIDSYPAINIIKRISDNTFWQVVIANDPLLTDQVRVVSIEQVFEHLEFVQKTVFKNTAPTSYSVGFVYHRRHPCYSNNSI